MPRPSRRRDKKLRKHLDLEPSILGTQLDEVLEEFEFNALPYQGSRAPDGATAEQRLLARMNRRAKR
jgi:hypothetical protein